MRNALTNSGTEATIRIRQIVVVVGLLALGGCEIGIEQPSGPSAGQSVESAAPPPMGQPPTAARGPQVARGHLNFVEGFRAGSVQAAAEAKPMLVFFTAQWCRYCHQMADEAFTHPQVVILSQRFVCVLIDADAEPDVCRQFQVNGFPTIQFLSPSGVPLERVVGKQPGHQLMMAMQAALQNVARRQAESDQGPILQ